MRFSLYFALFAALPAHAADQWQDLLDTEVKTSQGLLLVQQDHKSYTYAVTLDGKKINGFDQGSSSAGFSEVLHIGSTELVVVAQYTGGIACPATYVVLQLSASPRLSKPFGNCSSAIKLVPGRASLKILMPRYSAHPDILSPAERQQLAKVDAYFWSNGVIKSAEVAR